MSLQVHSIGNKHPETQRVQDGTNGFLSDACPNLCFAELRIRLLPSKEALKYYFLTALQTELFFPCIKNEGKLHAGLFGCNAFVRKSG